MLWGQSWKVQMWRFWKSSSKTPNDPELGRHKHSAEELSNNYEIMLRKLVSPCVWWCYIDTITLSNTYCISISQHLTKVAELGDIPLASSAEIKYTCSIDTSLWGFISSLSFRQQPPACHMLPMPIKVCFTSQFLTVE